MAPPGNQAATENTNVGLSDEKTRLTPRLNLVCFRPADLIEPGPLSLLATWQLGGPGALLQDRRRLRVRGGKRKSFTWAAFGRAIEKLGIAKPRITESRCLQYELVFA